MIVKKKRLNKNKGQNMYLGQDNPDYAAYWGDEKLECSTVERDLGGWG